MRHMQRVIASCRFEEKAGWKITISTPLPEGTTYGLENFSSSLVMLFFLPEWL